MLHCWNESNRRLSFQTMTICGGKNGRKRNLVSKTSTSRSAKQIISSKQKRNEKKLTTLHYFRQCQLRQTSNPKARWGRLRQSNSGQQIDSTRKTITQKKQRRFKSQNTRKTESPVVLNKTIEGRKYNHTATNAGYATNHFIPAPTPRPRLGILTVLIVEAANPPEPTLTAAAARARDEGTREEAEDRNGMPLSGTETAIVRGCVCVCVSCTECECVSLVLPISSDRNTVIVESTCKTINGERRDPRSIKQHTKQQKRKN